ncbi:MAG: FtsX-like permease family protein, partial [Candidatus Zixiibacteriota bacterium]
YDSVNPLPRSFVIEIAPAYLNSQRLAEFAADIEQHPAVSDVYYSSQWLEKAESTRSTLLKLGLALGTVILLAALISSVNSIRLSSRARAVGFEQMQLVGAGKPFLAAPFLIEGFLVGGISTLAGWAVIFYARQHITFTQLELVLPPIQEIGIFCSAMAVLGVFSGYLGIRKLLK